jgi:hypothetical protein
MTTPGENSVTASKNRDPAAGDDGCDSCCTFNIHVEAKGDVHIHNNCAPPPEPGDAGSGGATGGDDHSCPSIGSCIPVVAGAKHKLSRDQKLAARAARNPIPSAIATSVLHTMRRFVLGKTAANSREKQVFSILEKMPTDFLACNVAAFDALSAPLRKKLFVPSLLLDPDQAIESTLLAQALTAEIRQRASVGLFGQPVDQERPGQTRLYVPSGEDFFSQVRICRVNNLRTANYIPVLNPGDYLPAEIQQDCAPVIVNGAAQVVCQVRAADCPGNQAAGVCGRVLDISQGDGVELQGVNYFNVDAKVRLTDKDTQSISRDVDGFVFGDVDTPVNETVNGVTTLINDCRVHDKLTFQVPTDLPPGIYTIQVIVPNNTGNPAFGSFLASNTEFINILPPPNAKFQIVMEHILAREETSPASWGSDEVGLHTVSCGLDLNQQAMQVDSIEFHSLDGEEFDSGTGKDITTVIFESEQPILAVVLGVVGYEIDSEHAYHQQISDWTEYFIEIVKKEWEAALAGLATLGGISAAAKLGWTGAIAAAIAAAVVGAIDLIVSLWAPADLIIKDTITLSIVDLDRLTSAYAPAPPGSSYDAGDGIVVNINETIPPQKIPLQYREVREYVCDDQDSRYELTYRYNRIA